MGACSVDSAPGSLVSAFITVLCLAKRLLAEYVLKYLGEKV